VGTREGGIVSHDLVQDVRKGLERVPQKTYYRIGEVAKITGVKPYVLRYWETEFKPVSPPKSKSGQRTYRRREIEAVLLVKKLLYEQRFTIAGARRRLNELLREERSEASSERETTTAVPGRVRRELEEIRDLLANA
jgi:DNA-binding transcriptional MerR regulator